MEPEDPVTDSPEIRSAATAAAESEGLRREVEALRAALHEAREACLAIARDREEALLALLKIRREAEGWLATTKRVVPFPSPSTQETPE
jgi:hypothetical protein